MQMPPISYVRTEDGYHIAHQVVGEGERDIVFLRMSVNHLELQWEHPRLVRFIERLAGIGRVVMYDGRGHGLSDAVAPGRFPTFEEWALDAVTVMDAVGMERAALVAASGGSFRAVTMAASSPDRVSSLVLFDAMAKLRRAPDYPFGLEEPYETVGTFDLLVSPTLEDRVTGLPVLAEDRDWYARYVRSSTSPGFVEARVAAGDDIDIRSFLSSVRVPTLVVSTGQRSLIPGTTRDVAERIEGSEFVEVQAQGYDWLFDDPDAVADPIERFLTGSVPSRPVDRMLATVLYTDIVRSSEHNVEAGDADWRRTLDRLDAAAADEARSRRGKVIKSLGDGHLFTFDGPGGAIACARSLIAAAEEMGVGLRAGVHTGEVERRGEDIGGVAATVGRRVCDEAAAGRVLVTGVVPQLVAGSEIRFTELGRRSLKGVGEWDLHEVV